jgi:hypothetical protein
MDKRSMKCKLLVAAAAACVAVAAMPGCELLVDFDRTKIPQDAGTVVDATTDGPQVDGQGGDSTTDAPMMSDAPSDGPVSEAGGGDASDGGGGDASDAGGMDAMGDAAADAPSEAATDAAADAGTDAGDGGGGQALFTIVPASLDFGTVAVNTTTAAYPFTVNNIGTASAAPAITVGGLDPSDFAASGCTGPLSPGGSCTLTVTFRPAAAGALSASLSSANGSPASVMGTGASAGTLSMTPSTNVFGNETKGMVSADMGFTVSNNDPVNAVTLGTPALTGQDAAQFSFDADGGTGQCAGTLAPSATCTLFVHFAPMSTTTSGFKYASVSIAAMATDGGAMPGTASGSVTGTAQ